MNRGLFSTLFLTDLDHTLFQSKHDEPRGVFPFSHSVKGDPQGYSTPAQAEMWDAMRHTAFCVGVTSRTPEQAARVVGWNPLHEHQIMLADHGLTLMYRNISKSENWEIIEGWSSPYMDIAKLNAKDLEQDGSMLFFRIMESFPEIVTEFSTKLTFTSASGTQTKLFYSLRAGKLFDDALSGNRPERLSLLRDLIAEHMRSSIIPMRCYELEGTISFLPEWFSKKSSVERLIGLLKSPGSNLMLDTRFTDTLKSIGLPRLIVTAGNTTCDMGFIGLGHFMIIPIGSDISNTIQYGDSSKIPVLTDVIFH